MKHLLKSGILVLVSLILTTSVALAAIVWSVPIIVVSTSATSYEMLACNITTNVDYMADNGVFDSADGLDTRVLRGVVAQKHMLADDRIMFATPLPANTSKSLIFTTGSANLTYFPVIVGHSNNSSVGFITVDDAANLEPSDNFTVEQIGWWNTDNGTDKNAIYKQDAFRTYISPTVAENITSTMIRRKPALDFVRANSDWVSIPDHADFSFTDGLGADEPFSIVVRVNLDDATLSRLVTKWKANKSEWSLQVTGADKLKLLLTNLDLTKQIGRETDAITGYEGSWIHAVSTYDGTELVGGIDLYIDSVIADTADIIVGAYDGMTNDTAVVELGSRQDGGSEFLDGLLAEVKIYDVALTQGEVTSDFNGGHKSANLVAWYKLDEGAGNPTDSSGNGHDATANLADWVTATVSNFPLSVTATGVESDDHTIRTEFYGNDTDLCTGGTATASGDNGVGFTPDRAFDDIGGGNFWEYSVAPPWWIQYDFGADNEKIITRYTLTADDTTPARMPKNWTFRGSNDESDWTTLDTQAGETFIADQTKTYDVSTYGSYRYYRFNITASNAGNIVRIAEIEMISRLALKIFVDGDLEDLVVAALTSIPNNGNNWTLMTNNTLSYADNQTIWVGGTKELWFRPQSILADIDGSTATLPDRTNAYNHGVITWGSNPSGVAVTLSIMESDYEPYFAPGTAGTQDVAPELKTPLIASDVVKRAAIDSDPFISGAEAIEDVTSGGLPVLLLYWWVYIVVAILIFAWSYQQWSNLILSGILFILPIGFGISQGIFDFWIIAALVMWLAGCVMLENRRVIG